MSTVSFVVVIYETVFLQCWLLVRDFIVVEVTLHTVQSHSYYLDEGSGKSLCAILQS